MQAAGDIKERERQWEWERVFFKLKPMKLNQKKKKKNKKQKQNKTKPRFGYRAKYRIWRENKVESLEERQISLVGSLSLSLTQGFLPQIQGPTQKTKALERTYRDLGLGIEAFGYIGHPP